MATENELRDFDPTKELGGGTCKGCGAQLEPWVFSGYCMPCIWNRQTGELNP